MCVCPAFCCAELPLIEAVKAGDLKRLQLELTAGADLNATDPHGRGSAVSYAASLGREECLQALLEAGADPEVRTEVPFLNISMTPLYAAAAQGHPGCVRLLLQHGAAHDTRSQGDGTPLLGAAMEGHRKCVEALLEGGCDIELATSYGQTPLMSAAQYGRAECLRALVKVMV